MRLLSITININTTTLGSGVLTADWLLKIQDSLPTEPLRGPDAGVIRIQYDFNNSELNRVITFPFLKSRIYHVFLFFIHCTATRIEIIPMTPPTKTGDFFGSVVETVPVGRVGDNFICDCVVTVKDVFSLVFDLTASRLCSAMRLFPARFGYVGSSASTLLNAAIASSYLFRPARE